MALEVPITPVEGVLILVAILAAVWTSVYIAALASQLVFMMIVLIAVAAVYVIWERTKRKMTGQSRQRGGDRQWR